MGNLRTRLLRWRLSRQPTTCDWCFGELPRQPVDRRYCSEVCSGKAFGNSSP